MRADRGGPDACDVPTPSASSTLRIDHEPSCHRASECRREASHFRNQVLARQRFRILVQAHLGPFADLTLIRVEIGKAISNAPSQPQMSS